MPIKTTSSVKRTGQGLAPFCLELSNKMTELCKRLFKTF